MSEAMFTVVFVGSGLAMYALGYFVGRADGRRPYREDGAS